MGLMHSTYVVNTWKYKIIPFFPFFHSREFRMKTTSDRYMACKVISIYIYIGMHLCVLNEMFVTFSVAMPQMNAWDSFTHKSNAIKRIKWKEKMLPTGKLNRIFLFFNSSNNNNKKSISYSIRVFDLQFTSRINVWLHTCRFHETIDSNSDSNALKMNWVAGSASTKTIE